MPGVEIIIYRNHLGFASSSTGNGSVRFSGEVLAWGLEHTIRSGGPATQAAALPLVLRARHSLPVSRGVAVVKFSVPGRSPAHAHLDSSRTRTGNEERGLERLARVQRAGLILLCGSPFVGFVFTLKAELVRRGWVADWGLAVDVVLLVAMFVLVVGGALVICVGIVGSWLPEAGTRKRANDSANLE